MSKPMTAVHLVKCDSYHETKALNLWGVLLSLEMRRISSSMFTWLKTSWYRCISVVQQIIFKRGNLHRLRGIIRTFEFPSSPIGLLVSWPKNPASFFPCLLVSVGHSLSRSQISLRTWANVTHHELKILPIPVHLQLKEEEGRGGGVPEISKKQRNFRNFSIWSCLLAGLQTKGKVDTIKYNDNN